MFDGLSQRLNRIIKDLRGQGRLTEENIQATLREVRMALLEADVALPVARDFVNHIRERAIGEEVIGTLTPGQALIRVVRDELTKLMGETCESLNLHGTPPNVILMAGLQGSGKTTTSGKLARRLKEKDKKTVLLASADIYRPAAIEQLGILAKEVGAEFFPSDTTQNPVKIAQAALDYARKQFIDVVIIDTAGRLHIDEQMMSEIKLIHAAIKPIETLFVIDSMMGQDAVNTAREFNEALPLTGVILTKTDGDSRGGAALSVRHITGKPIKFMGIGEKSTALEPFYPDRLASRILGMGDVLGLIEDVEQHIDREKTTALANKLNKGHAFDLQDFRDQMAQMGKMGGMSALIGKLPGLDIPENLASKVNDKDMVKLMAIIDSMTPQERRFPEILKSSRKRRVAAGSGTQVQDVNRLLKQFTTMQKMMKRMTNKGGIAGMMRAFGNKIKPNMLR